MPTTNFDIFQMAIRSSDASNRDDTERDFAERYLHTAVTSGHEAAEALARSETLFLLHQLDLDYEGAAYLRSHLR